MTDSADIGEDFKTPLEMLYHWEQTIPQQTWMRYVRQGQWQDVSWAEAGRQCRKVASALSALGLRAGDKVGIYGANSPHWIMADIACMMAGVVTVPIYTTMPMDKVSYVVDHSDMRALFVDGGVDVAGLREVLPSNTPLLAMPGGDIENTDFNWQQIQDSVTGVEGNPLRDTNDLWTIVYTSGTTGMPKGVMHSFSTLPHSASGIPEFTGSDSNSRLFSYLPLAHAAERVLVELQSIYSGALIGFNTSKDSFAADLREIRPTFFLAVPRIWTNLKAGIIAQLGDETWGALLKNPESGKDIGKAVLATMGMDAVKFAFSGAAPISTTDIQAWRALGMPLYEGFGQSEIMSGTINTPVADRVGSVGKIMKDVGGGLMISDIGEILLRAPGAMLGYYKDPEKTAETLVDGWIRTGDKGRIDEDGFLHITGRVKEIFKTAKGKYVAPAPIENVFSASSHVDQLCLVGSGLPQTLMLVILAPSSIKLKREDISKDLENQRQLVNKNLEAHERISHVVVCAEAWTIENRLLTHTLKILRDDVEKNHAGAIGLCMEGTGGDTVNWESTSTTA